MSGKRRSYLDLIAGVDRSVQIGDMGDAETYQLLADLVDVGKHRFFPGNHEHFPDLPPHCLGDFGATCWGGVDFFFVRGAASSDRDKLVRMGQYRHHALVRRRGADGRPDAGRGAGVSPGSANGDADARRADGDRPFRLGERASAASAESRRPRLRTVTHERVSRPASPRYVPRLWLFGHHHYDWRYREAGRFSSVPVNCRTSTSTRREPSRSHKLPACELRHRGGS